jgi:hypothetical protein
MRTLPDALPFLRLKGGYGYYRFLLATVLPDEGFYCIVGLKKTSLPKQLFADTLAEG